MVVARISARRRTRFSARATDWIHSLPCSPQSCCHCLTPPSSSGNFYSLSPTMPRMKSKSFKMCLLHQYTPPCTQASCACGARSLNGNTKAVVIGKTPVMVSASPSVNMFTTLGIPTSFLAARDPTIKPPAQLIAAATALTKIGVAMADTWQHCPPFVRRPSDETPLPPPRTQDICSR